MGDVRMIQTKVRNQPSGGGYRNVGGSILSPKTKSNGYKEVAVSIAPQVRRMFYVHRLVAEAFIGEIKRGYSVNHKDGNKANNRVENLEIVTYSENVKHSYRVLGHRSNPLRGEDSHFCKITGSVVKRVKELLKTGMRQKDIGAIVGLGQSHVSRIHRGESWSHIK